MPSPRPSPQGERESWLRFALVAAQVVGAGLLAWPPGPLGQPHRLEQLWLPLAVMLAGVLALAAQPRSPRPLLVLTRALGAMWLGAALTCAVLFPASTWRFGVVMVVLGVVHLVLARPLSRGPWLAAALLGGTLAAAQRAPAPSTRPLGGDVGAATTSRFVDAWCGGLPVRVAPLLDFDSCAPDRFWAVWRDGTCPGLAASSVRARRDGARTVIEAESRLDVPVFSHLNAFTVLHVERAGLSLSLGDVAPVRWSDGTGRLRFFWLDDSQRVHLAQGAHDEKGPFTELAQAPLVDGRLVLTLHDALGAACRVTFEGWAAQASVAPSPTAGWDLPQNAGELLEGADVGVSELSLSLAATSVGEGWDSVGHAPGVYRNVVLLESLRD